MSVSPETVLVQLSKLDCNFLQYLCEEDRFALRSVNNMLYDTILPFNDTNAELVWYAAWKGDLPLVEWLHARDSVFGGYPSYYAAAEGHLNIIIWLHEHNYPLCPDVHIAAAASGHVHILQWMCNVAHKWNAYEACIAAAEEGQTSVLEWVHDYTLYWTTGTCTFINAAAKYGHMQTVQWLYNNGSLVDERTCAKAAGGGHLDILEWLLANNCTWNKERCVLAAVKTRQWALLEWLQDKLDAQSTLICTYAASLAQWSVLKWARQHGYNWNKNVWLHVVENTRVCTMFQWLYDNNCPWDDTVCEHAAKHGNLTALKWLRAHGCPWTHRVCFIADSYEHVEMLQWAIANGCPHSGNDIVRLRELFQQQKRKQRHR